MHQYSHRRAIEQANSLPRNPPPIIAIDLAPLAIMSSNSSKSEIPLNNVTLSLMSCDAFSNNGRFWGVEPKTDTSQNKIVYNQTETISLKFQLQQSILSNIVTDTVRWHKYVLCCTNIILDQWNIALNGKRPHFITNKSATETSKDV